MEDFKVYARRRKAVISRDKVVADPVGTITLFRETCFAAFTDDDAMASIPDTDVSRMCMTEEGRHFANVRDLNRLLDAGLMSTLCDIATRPDFLERRDVSDQPLLILLSTVKNKANILKGFD